MPSPLFADTSFWIALLNKRDSQHSRALAWKQWWLAKSLRLLTTEAVMWELLNAMSHPASRKQAHDAYQQCHADRQISIVGFDTQLIRPGLNLYRARGDKAWSLTDCLSFEVMHQNGVTKALAHDYHFGQAGFECLLLSDPS